MRKIVRKNKHKTNNNKTVTQHLTGISHLREFWFEVTLFGPQIYVLATLTGVGDQIEDSSTMVAPHHVADDRLIAILDIYVSFLPKRNEVSTI